MQSLFKIICLVVINIGFSFAQTDKTVDVTVNISNLNSNNGKVFVGLYKTKESFLNKGYKYLSTEIKHNTSTVTFKDVPNGVYAISMYHDENDNDKMDSNFLGIPKEDYGCSNNAKGFMGPPKWEDAKFVVANKSITQNIKL